MEREKREREGRRVKRGRERERGGGKEGRREGIAWSWLSCYVAFPPAWAWHLELANMSQSCHLYVWRVLLRMHLHAGRPQVCV